MDERDQLDKLRKMKRMKELQAKAGEGPAADAQPKIGAGLAQAAPDWLKQAVGIQSAARNGTMKGASMGYVNNLPGTGAAQASKDHPVVDKLAEVAGGSVPGMAAGAMLPAAGPGILSEAAAAAKQGALLGGAHQADSLADHAINAGVGGVVGGGVGLATGATGKALGYVGRKVAGMDKDAAGAYLADPQGTRQMSKMLDTDEGRQELQRQSEMRLNSAQMATKDKGLGADSKLTELLKGKTATIQPSKIAGVDPALDSELQETLRQAKPPVSDPQAQFAGQSAPAFPDSAEIPANDARRLKQLYGKQANFPAQNLHDAIQQSKNPDAGAAMHSLGSAVEDAGGIGPVSDLNRTMQRSFEGNGVLSKALTNPTASLKTGSVDKAADLYNAGDFADVDLRGLGHKMRAAETFNPPGADDRATRLLRNYAGAGAMEAGKAMQSSDNAGGLGAILSAILGK